MGEIADSMIEGEICTICGLPFKESYGYPLACQDCGGDGVLDDGEEE